MHECLEFALLYLTSTPSCQNTHIFVRAQNPYNNQDVISNLPKASKDNIGYQNVPSSPTQDESYTSVGEFLHNRSDKDNLEESEAREYYNFIPGEATDEEMYVYMQSGLAGADGKPSFDKDRPRLGKQSTSSVRYVNLSKQEQVNSRLPGAEYGEIAKDPGGVASNGVHPADGEQPIYANCEEEELYTTMS